MGLLGDIGGALIGGIFGSKQQKSSDSTTKFINQQQIDANRMNLRRTIRENRKQADIDRKMQYEFAKHGVAWKARDARRSGLNPIVAMGSSVFASPAGKPVSAPNTQLNVPRQNNWMAEMGQDIGSAISRFSNKKDREKADAMAIRDAELDLEYKKIRNQMANDDLIKRQTQAPVEFPMSVDPMATSPAVQHQPKQVIASDESGMEVGQSAGSRVVNIAGRANEMPAESIQDFISESIIDNMQWQTGKYGREIKDSISALLNSPKHRAKLRKRQKFFSKRLKKGYEYRYDYWTTNRGWKIAKIGPEGSQLFYDHKKRIYDRQRSKRGLNAMFGIQQ